MTRSKLFATVSMLTILAGTSLAPLAAQAHQFHFGGGQLQTQKNDWRNAALASAAVGIYGLATHQKAAAIAGTIGTVVAVSQYDRDQTIQNGRECRDNGYTQPVVIVTDHRFDNRAREIKDHSGRVDFGRDHNRF